MKPGCITITTRLLNRCINLKQAIVGRIQNSSSNNKTITASIICKMLDSHTSVLWFTTYYLHDCGIGRNPIEVRRDHTVTSKLIGKDSDEKSGISRRTYIFGKISCIRSSIDYRLDHKAIASFLINV